MGDRGPVPMGRGFSQEREGTGVCRLHPSIKKTYLKLHLLNWRHLTGLSNRAIVLATLHQMFPLGIVIGKVHSGDCLSCRVCLDGQRCLRWATPTGRRTKHGLSKPSGPTARGRLCRLTAERLCVWWSETARVCGVSLARSWWLIAFRFKYVPGRAANAQDSLCIFYNAGRNELRQIKGGGCEHIKCQSLEQTNYFREAVLCWQWCKSIFVEG